MSMSKDFTLLLMNKKQVCAALGVSPVTLWRWVCAGHFPKPIQLGPRRVAWRSSAVEAFLAKTEAA
ncbi:helix-turn-helix transcriptional regulator [Pseudomonas veronii]|uniref:helix-turn-helix transcriptional regulator n=2 Tax=Pseudomonas fluorescens group TaxID=136843 RepID=UPI002D79C42F|nr:AlpA family phage regulatory protein [Pseudomonas veronii]WRU62267.1 AlpA family phage regulatory protein [Pseudomonas veronii]